ncbi:MAG: pyrimidine dimer DNA glycosylase/endonuclease V [Firmicutes bacterium]|nr:pyrimidine dimer DNA glycosylase/endonuclease V [Bacillota bacterium]MDD4337646.1 pyrimidine dimer DNA glycosylase/endonuclease V [Bacillota bacterium]
MWNVHPRLMCRKHLLGEHVEMHMFAGTLVRGMSIQGYIDGGLVEVENIRRRHDELAEEMKARGFKHASPLRDDCPTFCAGRVDAKANIIELARRCPECAERIRSTGRDHELSI